MAQINQQQLIDLIALNGQRFSVIRSGGEGVAADENKIDPEIKSDKVFTVDGLILETKLEGNRGTVSMLLSGGTDYTPEQKDILKLPGRSYVINSITPYSVSGTTPLYEIEAVF